MKFTTLSLTISALVIGESAAQLSIRPWGSESSASVADRRFTSSATNFNFAPTQGGAGQLTSSNSLAEPRGEAYGSSALDASNGISVPLVRTFASTNGGNSAAFGSSVAIEGYTYSGAAPAIFSLDANLSGSVVNPDNNFAGNFAGLSIWQASSPFAGEFFFSTDEGAYLELGFNNLAQLNLSQNGIGTDDLLAGTMSWEMQPGETVYLFARGLSRVFGPNSIADARNTLTMSFQDSTGLTSLSGGTVIPEPSGALLALLGGLVMLRRRR